MMSKKSESCPSCGETHNLPFSKEVIEAYREFKLADDPDEREMLCFKVAGIFAHEFDLTDHEFNEVFHENVEEFKEAENKFDRSARKLTRMVVNFIDSLKIHELEDSKEEPQEDKPN